MKKYTDKQLNARVNRLRARLKYHLGSTWYMPSNDIRELAKKNPDDESLFQTLLKAYSDVVDPFAEIEKQLEVIKAGFKIRTDDDWLKKYEALNKEYDELQVKYVRLNGAYQRLRERLEVMESNNGTQQDKTNQH